MQWRFCQRPIAIGGICLMVTLATGALAAPAHAQAQPVTGFNPFDPQWALANPYTPFGFNAGSNMTPGTNQQAYTAKLGSGTVGLFVESGGISGNSFGPQFVSPTSGQPDWFTNVGDPAWRTSVVGSYKSNPNAALLGGLYTTASFGVTSIRTNPSGLPGLTNFYAGNDAVGVTASAGLGLQLTPQISVEGSFGYTQMPASAFR
jgi:hypothetical protein